MRVYSLGSVHQTQPPPHLRICYKLKFTCQSLSTYSNLLTPFGTLAAIEGDNSFELIGEIDEINNGGAALTAYGRTQYTDMNEQERNEIKESLLKYCELDTLAMVMIYEHFREELV